MQLPLLEAGDFDAASKSDAAAAAMNEKYKRAFPPSKSHQCTVGEPVDMGTGYVVASAVDLTLPGFIRLEWSRSYTSSSSSHRGALGRGGWTHSFEQWVEVTETGFRLHDEEGLPVEFGPIDEHGFSFHRGKRLELRRSGHSIEVRSLANRLIRTFSPLSSGRSALRAIRDPRNHHIHLEYDGNVLRKIIDSVGRELRLTSDAKGRVARVEVWASDPGSGDPPTLQTWFDYRYHPEGELASHTDALGYAERWEYDGLHRMVKVTFRNGVSFYYEYDADSGHCVRTWGDGGLHDVRIEIDFEKGETCTHGTNRARRYLWKNGLVYREETYGGEWATERTYDEDELLIARRNGAGEEICYEYDARGNLIAQTDPAGNIARWDYQDDLPVRRLGPTGLETHYKHDGYGSLIGITAPTGSSYHFDLDREGRLSAIHDRDGVRARLGYDEHSNVSTDTSTRRATTSYRHDPLGRPSERTDPLGRTTRISYDRMGNVLERVRHDGTQSRATYNCLGKLASTTDALGQLTQLEYAGTGHLARFVQADGQVYRFYYDEDERLIRILNPRLEEYRFDYNHADQITSERSFDERLVAYRYSRAGHVTRVEYPEGEWREIRYDKLGNVVEDRGSDVQVTFDRDMLGRIDRAVCQDVTGKVVTQFERDRFGRIVADIQNGRAVRYEYDERGRRTARVLPDGERTEYHYDQNDALAGVTHEGQRISIGRDLLGRERTRSGQRWTVEREYDEMDRLSSQKVLVPEPGRSAPLLVAQHRYEYDVMGRVKSIDSLHLGRTTYQYDQIDQLVEAASGSVREIFEYDPTGSLVNMLSDLGEVGRKPPWSFAPGNQLKATENARYVNDGRGRRIQRIQRTGKNDLRGNPLRGNEEVTTYGWDSRDRLREVVRPDGVRVRFTYDAFGRRAQKDVLPPESPSLLILDPDARVKASERRTVAFLWDGDVLCEEQDSSKEERSRKRIHVHEPGTFVPMLQAEQGRVFGVINDHLGMPKELVDAGGRVAWRAQHSAWGRVLRVSRDPGAPEVESPFRLMGQYEDGETELCYTRFRFFEASTGRWLSTDPLGPTGGQNLLAMDGSPTLQVDPWGLECISVHRGDDNSVSIKDSKGLLVGYATIDDNGYVTMGVYVVDTKTKARLSEARGEEVIRAIVNEYNSTGSTVRGIWGEWSGDSTNLAVYRAARGDGKSQSKAALSTPTGKTVSRSPISFGNATVTKDTPDKVSVLFTP